jgi:hypothetical protein
VRGTFGRVGESDNWKMVIERGRWVFRRRERVRRRGVLLPTGGLLYQIMQILVQAFQWFGGGVK